MCLVKLRKNQKDKVLIFFFFGYTLYLKLSYLLFYFLFFISREEKLEREEEDNSEDRPLQPYMVIYPGCSLFYVFFFFFFFIFLSFFIVQCFLLIFLIKHLREQKWLKQCTLFIHFLLLLPPLDKSLSYGHSRHFLVS